jgi:hypothetical protein
LQNVFQELSLVILLGKTDAVSRFRHLFWILLNEERL